MPDLVQIEALPLLVAAIIIGAVLTAVALFFWRRYRLCRERLARRTRIANVAVDYLTDVLVPDTSGGGMHVDYLLLTPRGLLLLDMRDVVGNVFGSDSMTEWTVMNAGRRFTFTNPQVALYDRIAALRAIAGAIPVEGRVVFSRGALFPKGMPRMTLREESLEADFLFGERSHAEQMVATWQDDWQRIKRDLERSGFPSAA
jgi:hypothetical protein